MRLGKRQQRLLAAAAAFGAVAFASAGCMQYAPDGSVATPPPPGQTDSSRLPQLLSQRQGARPDAVSARGFPLSPDCRAWGRKPLVPSLSGRGDPGGDDNGIPAL
jgi:hypothetical protein